MPLSTEDIKDEATNLFLFVGPADSGKSYAASSWGLRSEKYGGQDPRPAYMLELDGRIRALRGRPIQYDYYTNKDGAIGVLNRVVQLRNKCVSDNRAPFHTLIFDSFTSYNDFSIADSLEITEKRQASGDDVGRKRGELTLMTIEDYGYEAESVRKLMWENLIDIKAYADVIVIAHEVENYKTVKTKPGEPSRTELDGYKILAHGNKIAARLPTKFDEIYHFGAKEVIVSQRTVRRKVCFQDRLARSSYPQLNKSTEEYDITGKEFYLWWKEMISKPV